MGAEWFLSDEQTDMTKLIVAFRNFGNAPGTAQCNQKAASQWMELGLGCFKDKEIRYKRPWISE